MVGKKGRQNTVLTKSAKAPTPLLLSFNDYTTAKSKFETLYGKTCRLLLSPKRNYLSFKYVFGIAEN